MLKPSARGVCLNLLRGTHPQEWHALRSSRRTQETTEYLGAYGTCGCVVHLGPISQLVTNLAIASERPAAGLCGAGEYQCSGVSDGHQT